MENREKLEEIAEKLIYDENMSWENAYSRESFIEGVLWQQERSYSEEDVINALHSIELKDNRNYLKIWEGMKEWFQKKKSNF